MRFCAIGRTLGEHLGHVADAATGVSSSTSYDIHGLNTAGTANTTAASRDHELP
jgi:hypothetical protein